MWTPYSAEFVRQNMLVESYVLWLKKRRFIVDSISSTLSKFWRDLSFQIRYLFFVLVYMNWFRVYNANNNNDNRINKVIVHTYTWKFSSCAPKIFLKQDMLCRYADIEKYNIEEDLITKTFIRIERGKKWKSVQFLRPGIGVKIVDPRDFSQKNKYFLFA